ncbi:hypothetical protein [uncultured Imperialibacter sp.]|uniref:hypothetical protein n=1 Tax=uncultured Imperialibacter sp. TaxID=1672639 RepID=UPI0030DC24A3|tara:strand:+ start:199742 stop:200563 length:822 start_codon:yes stop_codon:yes gene_type:complete
MVQKLLLSVCIVFLALRAVGQAGDYSLGARSAAVGTTSSTLTDQFSLFNNPAGLAQANSPGVFASYENRYRIEDFQVMGAGASIPFGKFTTGVGFYRFGGKLYTEQLVSLKLANKIGFVSLGGGVSYVQYNIPTIGTRGVLVVDLGGIATINKQWLLGAHIYNLTQSKLVPGTGERVPTVMKLGVSYRPITAFMVNMEVSKDINYKPIARAGMEYFIIPQLALRTGFSTGPFISCFGLGFKPGKFQIDYAFRNDARLGELHQMSVIYAFADKK